VLGEHPIEALQGLNGHDEKAGQAFIRPHEIGISRIRSSESDLVGIIRDIRIMGSQIGLELESAGFDKPIEAEIPRDIWRNLELSRGEEVFVTLNKVKVFTGDYEI
jgi:sulfate transport system ATP-binding protein